MLIFARPTLYKASRAPVSLLLLNFHHPLPFFPRRTFLPPHALLSLPSPGLGVHHLDCPPLFDHRPQATVQPPRLKQLTSGVLRSFSRFQVVSQVVSQVVPPSRPARLNYILEERRWPAAATDDVKPHTDPIKTSAVWFLYDIHSVRRRHVSGQHRQDSTSTSHKPTLD